MALHCEAYGREVGSRRTQILQGGRWEGVGGKVVAADRGKISGQHENRESHVSLVSAFGKRNCKAFLSYRGALRGQDRPAGGHSSTRS